MELTQPQINQIFRHHFSFTKEQITTYAQISGDVNPIYVSDVYGSKNELLGNRTPREWKMSLIKNDQTLKSDCLK